MWMQPELQHELDGLDEMALQRGRCYFLLLMPLSLAAFCLSMIATWTCNFAQREIQPYDPYDIRELCQDNGNNNFTDTDLEYCEAFFHHHGIGFSRWEIHAFGKTVCMTYETFVPIARGYVKPNFDAAFKSAFGFSILASIFAAFGLFHILITACWPVTSQRLKYLSLYFLAAFVCQSFTFLLFRSDACQTGFLREYAPLLDLDTYLESVQCRWGEGAILSLTATCLYGVCAGLALRSVDPFGYKHRNRFPTRMEAPSSDEVFYSTRQPQPQQQPHNNKPLKIIIAGAPASGKGTQCEIIKEKFGAVHLSTGDMLRAAVAAGTKVGLDAIEYMDSGRLVPDDVIIGVVKERLHQEDCEKNGWLLDGFPRTRAQAKALKQAGIRADCFLFLSVPDEVLVERVVGRRTDPVTGKIYHLKFSPPSDPEVEARLEQRSDDTEEKVKVRLQQFHANVDAVKDSYTDIRIDIDGNRPPQDVSATIIDALSPV